MADSYIIENEYGSITIGKSLIMRIVADVVDQTRGVRLATLKEILPKIRIAGPGYIPDSDPQYDEDQIRMFLSHCEYQPDVFTMLSFPYNRVGMSIYDQSLTRDATRNVFYQQTSRVREILTALHFKGEFWITECGISVVNRNYIQDSCYRGATMLEQMLAGNGLADSIGVFFGSDLIGAYSDSAAEICGSGGLLTRSGIRKPIYYAYRFLRQMGDRRLLNAAKICATCFHPGDIRIVCWNRKNLGPRYYTQPEDSFRLEQIDQIGIHHRILRGLAQQQKERGSQDHQQQNIKADVPGTVALRFQKSVTSLTVRLRNTFRKRGCCVAIIRKSRVLTRRCRAGCGSARCSRGRSPRQRRRGSQSRSSPQRPAPCGGRACP